MLKIKMTTKLIILSLILIFVNWSVVEELTPAR